MKSNRIYDYWMSAFGEDKGKKQHADWMKDPFVADEGIYVNQVKPIFRETDAKPIPMKKIRTRDFIIGAYCLFCGAYVALDCVFYLFDKLFS